LEEVKENWLLEIDRQVKLLLQLILSSTKRAPSLIATQINQRSSTVSTWLLDKRDLLLPTSWKSWKITTHLNTQSSLLLLHQKLLHFNSWLLIQDALLENTSEIMVCTPWSSMMIFQSKPSPTDKCHSCWEDHPVERPIQEMSSISILVFWKELLRWTNLTAVVL